MELVLPNQDVEVLAPFSQAQRPGKTELRLFGGLVMDETSELLAISPATLKRPWATACIWLHHEVGRNAHTCLPNAANRSATCSDRGMLHSAFNRTGAAARSFWWPEPHLCDCSAQTA